MERDAFYARVRTAAAAARLPAAPEPDPGLVVPDLAEGDLVELFTARLQAVGGVAHRDVDPAEVIGELAAAHGASDYLGWDDRELPDPGLGARLAASGVRRRPAVVPSDPEGRRHHQMGYLDAVLGVTGAEAGLAETGSIVVRSGPGRPRMASLIPDIHVAVLRAEDIHRSLAHWAAVRAGSVVDAANVVVITGPSRTGDIEMRLNVGVHGPREIHVVLI